MKTIRSYHILILLGVTLIMFNACKSNREEDTFSSMDDFYNKYKQEEQEFIVDSPGTGPIIGKEGSRLYVSRQIFMYPDSSDITYPFTIKLIELYTAKDMILYNMPTVAGGKILESGGEIRVRAFKDGIELVLKPGEVYTAEMPASNLLSDMQVYCGFTSGNITDWAINAASGVTNITGYYQLSIAKMGWINCGKLFKDGSNKSTITFNANGSGTAYIDVFVVIEDAFGIMQAYHLVTGDLPVGENVRIIAMAMDQHKKYRLYNMQSTVSASMQLELTLDIVSEETLLAALTAL